MGEEVVPSRTGRLLEANDYTFIATQDIQLFYQDCCQSKCTIRLLQFRHEQSPRKKQKARASTGDGSQLEPMSIAKFGMHGMCPLQGLASRDWATHINSTPVVRCVCSGNSKFDI